MIVWWCGWWETRTKKQPGHIIPFSSQEDRIMRPPFKLNVLWAALRTASPPTKTLLKAQKSLSRTLSDNNSIIKIYLAFKQCVGNENNETTKQFVYEKFKRTNHFPREFILKKTIKQCSTSKTVFVKNQCQCIVPPTLYPGKWKTPAKNPHSKLNPIITGWMESEKQWKIYLVYSVL